MKIIVKQLKDKVCRVCETKFTPFRSTQVVCNYHCANIYAKELNEKKEKKDWQKRKATLKKELLSLSDWLKLAQQVFNKYIRERDKNQLCISCGNQINGVKHASHFLSSGGHSNVRFHEDNVWVSCYKCNVMLSGNQIEYRKRLIQKIGLERVEWLENNGSKERKYNIQEIKELIELYKNKLKNI